jgi:fido (protein-threonine AMPylation protein)
MASPTQTNRRGRTPRKAVYARFAGTIESLENYGGLPTPDEAKGLWDDFWFLEAHHSTAIEGNTLVLKEVEKLLEEGRAVGSKELRDYLEVLGYGEAADWVYRQAIVPDTWVHGELVSLAEVRYIHKLAMSRIWDVYPHPSAHHTEAPGGFREHDIRPFSGGMIPPTHPLIPSEISTWIDTVNEFGGDVNTGRITLGDAPEKIAFVHKEFERIHPFLDGNGRTGRLLLNLILLRLGWPPAIVFKNQRSKYIDALDKADNGDCGPLAELLCRAVIDSAHHLIPSIAGPIKLVPLEALADAEFSLSALKKAAVRGRLEVIKGDDGRYLSSRAAVQRYKESKFKGY